MIKRSDISGKLKRDLVDDVVDLSKQLDVLRKQVRTQAARPAAVVKESNAQAAEIREAVADLSVEGVVRQVTDIGLSTQRAFDDVTTQLVDATKQLDTVRDAVQLEEERIQTLHGIDIVAVSLAQLIGEYDGKQTDMKTMVETMRADFDDERSDREAEQAEFEAGRNQTRKREEADYDYKMRIARRSSEDMYARKCEDTDRARQLRQADEDRVRAGQVAELGAAETELDELRQFHDAHDAAIAEAEGKAAGIAGSQVKRKYEHDIALMTKDHDAAGVLAETKIETLTAGVVHATAEIESLQSQLQAAQTKNIELATQALKSAEGQATLAEVRGFMAAGRDGASTGGKRN